VVKLRYASANLLIEGPHLPIIVSATKVEVQEGRAVGLDYTELPVRALIDTGASITVINPEIATTCKLKQTGYQKVSTVGGAAGEYPEYAAAISFPESEIPRLETVRVVACPIIRQPFFSCLIGRDILQRWIVIYNGRTGELEIRPDLS
jgi:predicted aspartyl protease